MTKQFKIIPDTEGVYGVSPDGRVKNMLTDVVLSPFFTSGDYLCVTIQFSGRNQRSTVKVHRLVAQAFLENPFDKPYVNHIDGNKQNNAVGNLEWVTPLENNIHAVDTGLIAVGEDAPASILSEKNVLEVIDRLRAGHRNIDIARDFNVAHNTVDDIRCNRTWRHIVREPIAGNGAIKKLSEEDVRWIKRNFNLTNRVLGSMFNVAPATIDQIRRNKTWKHIKV